MLRSATVPALLLGLLSVGCPPRAEDPGATAPAMEQPGSLSLLPGTIDVVAGAAEQRLSLTAQSPTNGDVTAQAAWALSDPDLGAVQQGQLVVRGGLRRGGRALVTATFGAQSGVAELRVKYLAPDLVDASAPPAPGSYFSGEAGGARPAWVYPLDNALLPRNEARMNLQFQGTMEAQAYRVVLDSPTYRQTVYLGPGACPGGECQLPLPDERWQALTRSAAGGALTLTLAASPGPGWAVGSAAPLTLSISPEDVRGGLYYWSTSITGIYRVPIGAKAARVFIEEGNEFGCAGCHAVSRDGKKVALEFGGANGLGGGVVDGADGKRYLLKPPDAGQWNLQTFSPKGDLLLVNWRRGGRVINADTGQKVVDFPETLAQPEWSPDGKSIVYVRFTPQSDGNEWIADNTGDITVIPWKDGAFGEPQVIVPHKEKAEYHFYPTWTPDSRWIIFNTGKVPCDAPAGGDCNSYDATNTVLRLVRAVPGATPIDLTRATHRARGSTNWPRVAPFVQDRGRLIFFTFSARYPYGFVKAGPNPQIWMAAVDLGKAEASPTEDPSYAPFWMTAQQPTENNHLGTWTQDLACAGDDQCPSEFQCSGGVCVTRTPG